MPIRPLALATLWCSSRTAGPAGWAPLIGPRLHVPVSSYLFALLGLPPASDAALTYAAPRLADSPRFEDQGTQPYSRSLHALRLVLSGGRPRRHVQFNVAIEASILSGVMLALKALSSEQAPSGVASPG